MSNTRAQINRLKKKARRAMLAHRGAADHLSCGNSLAAHISPGVASAARDYNEAMYALKALDPDNFPAEFAPLPE